MKRFTSIFSTPPCGSYEYEVGECDFVTKNDGCSQYFYKDKRNGKHYKCKNSDSDGPDTQLCVQSKEICSFDRQEALQEGQEALKIKKAQEILNEYIKYYHLVPVKDPTWPELPPELPPVLLSDGTVIPPESQWMFALDAARYKFAHHYNIDPDKLKIDPDIYKEYAKNLRLRSHHRSKSGRRRSRTSTKRSSTKRSSTKGGSTKRSSTKGGSKKRYTKKHTKRKNKCRR